MSSEYDMISRGKLKLKTDLTSGGSIKKKKKKSKSKDLSNQSKTEDMRSYSRFSNDDPSTTNGQSTTAAPVGGTKTMTKAEVAFKKMQEKMQEKRIMEKAGMTHKQRVEKFNEHLDGLTEHFDIPKVSWTK